MQADLLESTHYDAVVVGSGFGGTMMAQHLTQAGQRVLMIERGDWVPRGSHNWAEDGALDLTPYYSTENIYHASGSGYNDTVGSCWCVGGPSVFYGGTSLRFRGEDFGSTPQITPDAEWPYNYEALEPYYTAAEQLLSVSGESDGDPTAPFRSGPYPQSLPELSETAQMIRDAGHALGLQPFRLPLAINYGDQPEQEDCVHCTTCDGFACAVGAKNDLATCLLPKLQEQGLQISPNTVAVKLVTENGRVTGVECRSRHQGARVLCRARKFIVAAGALGSAHLLLASGLEQFNPAGHTVGHYLMRHCAAVVQGYFPARPSNPAQFHKQLGFHDFYFGHPEISTPPGKLGNIQQLQTPPVGLVREFCPRLLRPIVPPVVRHLTGLLVIAEDQPQYRNHVSVRWDEKDRFGLPALKIDHQYTERDEAARDALIGQAQRILRQAGAWFTGTHKIKTFSHAVGSVRMGTDPQTAPLDEHCQFRGLDNLFVVDGSFMPTSAGVNPSLTIAANALRVAEELV